MKLYDTNKCDSFEMNFGFKQPDIYKTRTKYVDKRTKEYNKQRKHKGEMNKYKRNENKR